MADYDVVVIGGGGAGMAAAITAADGGATVLLAEAAGQLGGSTALSTGVFYAAGTSVQRAAGISDDNADAMFDYYLTLNQWHVDPAIVRTLCENAAPTIEWLVEIGVQFPPKRLYRSGVERVPRGHYPKGGGAAIARALAAQLDQRAVDIALGQRVTRLLTEGERVVGVEANGESVTSRAIVLSTGGFGRDRELLKAHYPDAMAAGDWAWSISAPTCVGDGLRMAYDVGAPLGGHNRGLLMITAGFEKILEAGVPPWTIFVNREGRRFVDESAPYAVMSGVVQGQRGPCWAIFDEGARLDAKSDPRWPTWEVEELARKAAEGRIVQGDSPQALAAVIGVPALRATVDQYNQDVARGRDSRFFKEGSLMRPLQSAPFYAAEIRPAIISLTSCGPRIDTTARVLGGDGEAIPGLYAAGETTGNVMGDRYIGGGNSIANALVFGRIAGRSAAATAVAPG